MSPDQPTVVVSDTTSYLPPEIIERLGIELVSLYVGVAGNLQRESEITDFAEFYEQLRRSPDPVTTSQPSIGDFTSAYEPILAEGREIVSVHISSGISGTYESALAAREQLITEGKGGERIHVFDSASAAGGLGLTVLEAATAAANGDPPARVLELTEAAKQNLKLWFAVDTLEFLRRGGRIGGAAAWIGSTLRIKPILTFEDEVTPVERVRTRSKARLRLKEYARDRHDAGADAWVVQHIQDPESAAKLVEECTPIFGCDPVFVSEIGPVIGAHAGPGLLGIGGVASAALSRAPLSAGD